MDKIQEQLTELKNHVYLENSRLDQRIDTNNEGIEKIDTTVKEKDCSSQVKRLFEVVDDMKLT